MYVECLNCLFELGEPAFQNDLDVVELTVMKNLHRYFKTVAVLRSRLDDNGLILRVAFQHAKFLLSQKRLGCLNFYDYYILITKPVNFIFYIKIICANKWLDNYHIHELIIVMIILLKKYKSKCSISILQNIFIIFFLFIFFIISIIFFLIL